METCKHGSGAGSRKPTAEMRQGAECRAYKLLNINLKNMPKGLIIFLKYSVFHFLNATI